MKKEGEQGLICMWNMFQRTIGCLVYYNYIFAPHQLLFICFYPHRGKKINRYFQSLKFNTHMLASVYKLSWKMCCSVHVTVVSAFSNISGQWHEKTKPEIKMFIKSILNGCFWFPWVQIIQKQNPSNNEGCLYISYLYVEHQIFLSHYFINIVLLFIDFAKNLFFSGIGVEMQLRSKIMPFSRFATILHYLLSGDRSSLS